MLQIIETYDQILKEIDEAQNSVGKNILKYYFRDNNKDILYVHGESLNKFRSVIPDLKEKYKKWVTR